MSRISLRIVHVPWSVRITGTSCLGRIGIVRHVMIGVVGVARWKVVVHIGMAWWNLRGYVSFSLLNEQINETNHDLLQSVGTHLVSTLKKHKTNRMVDKPRF
jgi:hypothetical protein